ncbi:TetR/AcrR family transcriptional regulator C-terminal domain-containing protein [Pseudonocardia sp. TRM90224]|uniref:TetR/AcrR family transcriptional regulator C-terminal domain-containing protein n=1 Tax=Pseudonocardia sp. TRM90224 TaxID=2812678 RepID=UPI001E57C782|nr:TetR/AcrR family transcriptional regulator C-terminal domain-containing protein [Pseudonocardia sp. TRM90224]
MTEASFRRIAADIAARIATGQLRPGHRVPSTRQVMREWGVANATAAKALAQLRAEGLVESRPGSATVVAGLPRSTPAATGGALSRDRITTTAIRIADTHGGDELSMRRLADELGVGPMSIYRHVSGKDELVHLMSRHLLSDYPLPDPAPEGWRARLTAECRSQWRMYRDHPWLTRLTSVIRPTVSPEGMARTEWMLDALDGLGLDPAERLREAIALPALVLGMASTRTRELTATRKSGLSTVEWWNAQEAELATYLAGGRFPHLASIDTADPVADLDALFELGLERHLDGLEARLRRLAGRS